MSFQLTLVTQEKSLLTDVVDFVQAKGVEGEFGVLTGHTPFLTLLDVGEFIVRKGESTYAYFVAGGIVEVLPHQVTVLADIVERADEIDAGRAEKARANAEKALSEPMAEDTRLLYQQAYRRASVRLRIVARRSAPSGSFQTPPGTGPN
ncbi:ATP synthase F1 subunit epsilon [Leptospirillum ferrooxidans]|jgi:F-type H+-transporting ATPase subunit epsilon|uniref:ATP synthase epsilon chain n=1 Tax=Leptospirillum ferrooxidans (strain C2-3) TaxID=1162668 RepID=I0IKK0_LEPFC|nr:ATP synthase F1 subunit epsilon [Leptospirillum ferrooxidans]BAM05799.1 putative ATP synthase F1, epsilon subunit [Leptospirillum ferrooxidans C2-3]